MTSSVGMVVMVVVSEQTETVSEPDTQEQSRPSLGAVLSETDPVVAHVWIIPKPNCGLSVAVSPDALSVDLRVELNHVSDGDTPWIGSKSGPETSKRSATDRKTITYPHFSMFSGTAPLCLRPSSLSILKSNR